MIAKVKFSISDLQQVDIATNSFRASKFILKNGREISFDSENLDEADISLLQALTK